jgi:hypothetical protein
LSRRFRSVRVNRFSLGVMAAVLGGLLLAFIAASSLRIQSQAPSALGVARPIAPGVDLYHVTDPAYLNPPGPVSIWLARVDTSKVDVQPVLSNDEVLEAETVADMGRRRNALVAINAGFFLPSGEPSGVYKIDGRLVSDTRRPRGAVGIVRSSGSLAPRFIFDRVTATATLRVRRRARPDVRMEIAGIDTTRGRDKLMLFTPAFHADTNTAAGGLEWTADGRPLRIRGAPSTQGKTPIPRNGVVLSYGGPRAPAPLDRLRPGTDIDVEIQYGPSGGLPDLWTQADTIVGGAGLIARNGVYETDWAIEQFSAGFAENRHPRTMIGTHADNSVWLVTVDGRQPNVSVGMTLIELSQLAARLGLVNALNLDGGGSTTMWVQGQVVNSPSDAAGPRRVSDALVVHHR